MLSSSTSKSKLSPSLLSSPLRIHQPLQISFHILHRSRLQILISNHPTQQRKICSRQPNHTTGESVNKNMNKKTGCKGCKRVVIHHTKGKRKAQCKRNERLLSRQYVNFPPPSTTNTPSTSPGFVNREKRKGNR